MTTKLFRRQFLGLTLIYICGVSAYLQFFAPGAPTCPAIFNRVVPAVEKKLFPYGAPEREMWRPNPRAVLTTMWEEARAAIVSLLPAEKPAAVVAKPAPLKKARAKKKRRRRIAHSS